MAFVCGCGADRLNSVHAFRFFIIFPSSCLRFQSGAEKNNQKSKLFDKQKQFRNKLVCETCSSISSSRVVSGHRSRRTYDRQKLRSIHALVAVRLHGIVISSWLFTRHCHYLINQLPAAAPPQAHRGTAASAQHQARHNQTMSSRSGL